MARKRGIRGVVGRLEADAHGTMATARGTMASVEELVRGLIEDLTDGVSFELEIAGKRVPVKLWMVPGGKPGGDDGAA
jgi:hypothetical protein